MRRAGGIAACAAGLVLAASGCGSDDISPDTLAKAAGTTSGVSGARASFRVRIANAQLPAPVQLRGEGVVEPRSRAARISFRAVPGPNLPRAGLQQLGGQIIVRRLTIYVRLGAFESRLPRGKRWLKLDLRRFGRPQGINLDPFLQAGQDPNQSVRYLRATSGHIDKLGKERVRGVSTTRYRATVDLRRYPRTLPPRQREAARRGVERLVRLGGTSRFPTEVWIDGHGLVRRQRLSLSTRTPDGTRQRVRQTIELFDFGARVRVHAPPEDQVLDATALAGAPQQPLR